MSNRLAPPFAMLFMHDLETNFLATFNKIPAIWLRYIDVIFSVWLHGVKSLEQFHHALNRFHPTIKFSLEHTSSMPSVPSLDTNVSPMKEGTIRTELYAKPTCSRILLHHSSAHPSSAKEAIAFSQMTRVLRVSSSTAGGNKGTEKSSQMLENNDYPTNIIEKLKKRATQRSRTQYQRKEETWGNEVLHLSYILDEITWRVRNTVKRSGLDIRIAQKNGPTLRSILTQSALELPQSPNHGKCMACQAGLEGRCTSKNVVYKLECILSSLVYNGETKRPIRER